MQQPTDLPSITIVTPSFQQVRYLERTIQSVLGQDYPNLEYLVMDGGSTDGSVEILKRYEGRCVWTSEKDAGQSDAVNKGLARAKGEIVGWLNSDDTLAPGALLRIGGYYRDHPDAEFLYGHVNLIDADDRILTRLFAVPTNSDELIRFNRNLFSQPGTTWRRRLQERIGTLDPSLHMTMDCDFYIRAAKATRLHFIPHHLANLRIHGESKTSTRDAVFKKEHQILDERYAKELNGSRAQQLFQVRRKLRILSNPANWKRLVG
jgi:glycosyltransferase involved in cell wall biosynthesis